MPVILPSNFRNKIHSEDTPPELHDFIVGIDKNLDIFTKDKKQIDGMQAYIIFMSPIIDMIDARQPSRIVTAAFIKGFRFISILVTNESDKNDIQKYFVNELGETVNLYCQKFP
jgi:hypothetical protein